LAEDLFDVGAEPDVEHPVGLVEHDDAELLQVDRPAAEVVEHAARRADNDVGAAFELADLGLDRLAAVHRDATHLAVAGQLLELAGDLYGEFARRHEDDRLRRGAFAAVVERLEDRDRERRGLAGAGPRLTEHVAAGQRDGDHARLDGRRRLVADLVERGEHLVGQAEFVETLRRGDRVGGFGLGFGLGEFDFRGRHVLLGVGTRPTPAPLACGDSLGAACGGAGP